MRHHERRCRMTFRAFKNRSARAMVAGAMVATVAFVAFAQGPGPASAGEDHGHETYSIGLFGDMPYNALGKAQYPALLADINASHVAFSVFDGDLKAGGDGACTDSLYTAAIANFNNLE